MRSLLTDSGCRLCPRNCGADREHGKTGFCKVPAELYAARAALHFWEEPCISGERGSGTVFFSGCTLRCVYCQNASIARADAGRRITWERLTEIFLELQEQGAHNINLVTPTHYAPWISKALQRAVDQGLKLPVVYNCGGYEGEESLRWMEGLVDIYLTDFKYMDSALAARYSQAPDYPEEAKKAFDRMFRQVGTPVFDGEGMMQKGIIVRHLLLPGALKNAKAVVKYVYETYGDEVYLSLMNQYTPLEGANLPEPLNRKVTKREYERLVDYALDLGVTNAFIQEGDTAKESFIPAFEGTGL
ncbi:MAG: radical SAM protein [Lacrimispora saccharolytica]